MSLTPRLTLIGLYNYNHALFSNLSLPAAVDEETFIDSLLMEFGECPLIYPNYDYMVLAIGAWSQKWYANIERIATALNSTYNPLHNYDRTETWTENETENKESTLNSEINDSENESSTDENLVSAYNESQYQPSNKSLYGNERTNERTNEETSNEDTTRQNLKSGRTYGNIGVTTSQQMINEEIETRTKHNIYHIISELFYKEFCLYVF